MEPVQRIQSLLTEHLPASVVQVVDQSHQHVGHQGRDPLSTGGHFAVTVVSPLFKDQTLMQRHRAIYSILSQDMGDTIHALTIKAYSPEQWQSLSAADVTHSFPRA